LSVVTDAAPPRRGGAWSRRTAAPNASPAHRVSSEDEIPGGQVGLAAEGDGEVGLPVAVDVGGERVALDAQLAGVAAEAIVVDEAKRLVAGPPAVGVDRRDVDDVGAAVERVDDVGPSGRAVGAAR